MGWLSLLLSFRGVADAGQGQLAISCPLYQQKPLRLRGRSSQPASPSILWAGAATATPTYTRGRGGDLECLPRALAPSPAACQVEGEQGLDTACTPGHPEQHPRSGERSAREPEALVTP